ncbi:hypothetical protein ABL78_8559 [Leptomonas seymouri]|uniref:EGF-like domain-containing protein n=1 Tax=Leptomonas seymouri TaxID=5684 RepID=A0A0N1HZ03_LEPSE|nr:hypothetical protein ABL78_8559 [Leptomonas seymouri]|eukprot:KPI82431.1 hypothetical protein ABL78_8559 [Leptomonas seymouri]
MGCNAVGGRCRGGVCLCVDGWEGENCDVPPVDRCRAYSLDGCAVCGQHAGCEFCFDSTCFNTSLRGTASGYVCSYSTPAADTRACRTYAEHGLTYLEGESTDGKVVLALLCIIVVVSAGFAFGCWWSALRNRRVTSLLAALAVVGEPNFRRPFMDRVVLKVAFLRQRFRKAPVVAVPLKQVSLKALFRRRAGMERREEPP